MLASGSIDTPPAPVGAYGEMVDLLAKAGNIRAAIRLEELWHQLLEENPFSILFCAPTSWAPFSNLVIANTSSPPCA
jgi:hypothetical protein